MPGITLRLSPHGHLTPIAAAEEQVLDGTATERIQRAFERNSGHGLLHLGIEESGTEFTPVLSWWRDFGSRYVTALCTHENADAVIESPPGSDLDEIVATAPPMEGGEYLTADVLRSLWVETDEALRKELAESGVSLPDFLKERNPAWNVVGRVHFNLAENRKDAEAPFAFLATYTNRLSASAKAQHVPLGQALKEYAGEANKSRLLSLLAPVQRASQASPWLKAMVDEGEIFYPLRWTVAEAKQLLEDVPKLQGAGVIVRTPAAWRGNRPPRPRVTGVVGGKPPSGIGHDALLDFQMEVTLDGERLSRAEIAELLKQTEGLALIRGRWVEVDREQLEQMLDRFGRIEQIAQQNGLRFDEAMRLLSGAESAADGTDEEAAMDWAETVAGPWLAQTLRALRRPESLENVDPGESLKGLLRPYQQIGVRWLYLLANLRLGGCLADDMGLGKTIQVIALLLLLKRDAKEKTKTSLLVVPASLLANWGAEIARFAPGLKAEVIHPSNGGVTAAEWPEERINKADLAITTYGTLVRATWISNVPWRLAVIDEAQAIKNPGAKQTKAVKSLKAETRLSLTGTPVENRIGDLWSLFDFINPGLLGSAKEFSNFAKKLASGDHPSYAPLRELVRPYILRRLKTDKKVISDLPDKTEVKAFCALSRQQAALYEQSVRELTTALENTSGIKRKGLVLSYLMRFKQICNHPSQWLADGSWDEAASGKWARLRDIAETVAARQEKMLVFTQFREITAPLAEFLRSVFGAPGLVLHGETSVRKRGDLVRQFQEDESKGFFVLSLKAGGTGLNLTAASHVVHFDRWWNPAVENQATDRAFRIGQKKNVLVQKFVCRGTVEEKIDELIESKKRISGEILEGGAEVLLTEMSDDELLSLVALDLKTALKES